MVSVKLSYLARKTTSPILYQRSFTDSVNRGIADAESGHVHTTSELREELEKRRTRRHAK